MINNSLCQFGNRAIRKAVPGIIETKTQGLSKSRIGATSSGPARDVGSKDATNLPMLSNMLDTS